MESRRFRSGQRIFHARSRFHELIMCDVVNSGCDVALSFLSGKIYSCTLFFTLNVGCAFVADSSQKAVFTEFVLHNRLKG